MSRLIVLIGWLFDILSLRGLSEPIFQKYATAADPAYPVHRAIWRMILAGDVNPAMALAEAHWQRNRSPRVGRDLVNLYIRKKQYDKAFDVAGQMVQDHPDSVWFRFLQADVAEFFMKDHEKALELYQAADPICEKHPRRRYTLAILFKRLGRLYRDMGDAESLEETLERHFAITPSNFRDKEFLELAQMRLNRGNRDGAKEVLEAGFQASKRSVALRQAYERMGFGTPPPIPPRKAKIPDMTGVTKIPVKTRVFREGDDPVEAVKEYAGDKVQTGDVVALSSCVAAIMEGRIVMEGAAPDSAIATLVGKLVARRHAVAGWGASAPMANPLSVQAALEEIGTLRLLVATVIGGIGQLLGKSGWFYSICGPQAGQIDDILGALPPYDYYVIMGVSDPNDLSNRMATALGEGIKAAIIDANDLGIAWAVGYSDGADPKDIERMMADNPAGNGEEQTPVVIVRRETQVLDVKKLEETVNLARL